MQGIECDEFIIRDAKSVEKLKQNNAGYLCYSLITVISRLKNALR